MKSLIVGLVLTSFFGCHFFYPQDKNGSMGFPIPEKNLIGILYPDQGQLYAAEQYLDHCLEALSAQRIANSDTFTLTYLDDEIQFAVVSVDQPYLFTPEVICPDSIPWLEDTVAYGRILMHADCTGNIPAVNGCLGLPKPFGIYKSVKLNLAGYNLCQTRKDSFCVEFNRKIGTKTYYSQLGCVGQNFVENVFEYVCDP